MPTLDEMMANPTWAKFSPSEKRGYIDKAFASRPQWMKFDPQTQDNYKTKAYRKAGVESTLLGGEKAEMRRGPGPVARALETGVQAAGFYGGEALGIPAGVAATALTAPVLGPAAPAAGFATQQAIAGAGGTVADVGIAEYNKLRYGTPTDLTPSNIAKDLAANIAASGVGAGVLGGLKGVGRAILGKGALEATAKETAAEAAAKGVRAAEKTQSVLEAQRREAGAEATSQIADLKTKVTGDLAKKAKSATIAQSLGRSESTTARAIRGNLEASGEAQLPGPGMTGRRGGFFDVVHQPARKIGDGLNTEYDKIFGPYKSKVLAPATIKPLSTVISDEVQFAQGEGLTHSPAIQKLMGELNKLGSDTPDLSAILNAKDLAAMTPAQKEEAVALMKSGKRVVFQTKTSGWQVIEPGQYQEKLGGTIGQLLGQRSEARYLTTTGEATDRATAHRLEEGVNNVLRESGVPGSKKLDAQWREYRTQFPPAFWRKVARSEDPIDYAGDIFNSPKRAEMILAPKNSTQQQRSALRRLYADWVNREGDKVITPEQAPILAKLFPGTPLANPKAFVYLDSKLAKFDDVIHSSPEVRAEFVNQYKSELHDIRSTEANKVVRGALGQLAKMPKEGQLVTRITDAAQRSPIEAADLIMKEMPGAAQREAIRGTQPIEAAAKGLAAPTTPAEAGIQSIQMGKLKGAEGGGIIGHVKRQWPMYAAITGLELAVHGSTSPYLAGITVIGPALMATSGVRKLYLRHLAADPEAARAIWSAIANPSTPQGIRSLARHAVQATLATTAADAIKGTTDVSLEAPSAPSAAVTPTAPPSPAPAPVSLLDHAKAWEMADQQGNTKAMKLAKKGLNSRLVADYASLSPPEREQLKPVLARIFKRDARAKTGITEERPAV